MEDKSSSVELWLDAYNQGTIDYAELSRRLKEAGIGNTDELLSLHLSAINIIQRYNVQQQVAEIHKKFAGSTSTVAEKLPKAKIISLSLKPLLRVAAIFIVIVASAGLFFVGTANQKSLLENLSQDYHVQITRDKGNEGVSQIVLAFNSKNFPLVIDEYRKIIHPSSREMFLGGYAFMQTGDYRQSASIFQSLMTQNNLTGQRLYQDEAEYYLLLSLIQLKQYKEALSIAEQINKDSYHTYHTKITSWLLLKLKWLS